MTLVNIGNDNEEEEQEQYVNQTTGPRCLKQMTKKSSFLGKIAKLGSTKHAIKFLKLFLFISCIFFIIYSVLFVSFPEQFYTVQGINQYYPNEPADMPDFSDLSIPQTTLSNDKKYILNGPNSGWARFLDAFYFTTTQFSTIGYGDITARLPTSKILCSISHILIVMLSFKFIGGSIGSYVKHQLLNKINPNH